MAILLNPVFAVASATATDWTCRPCVTTEAWVRQKRDPSAEVLSPSLYLAGFQGPYAANNMATWMATDEDGSFYVLARRQENANDKPWYVLTHFNACGDYIHSIHINKGLGFGHYLDVTNNPQIAVGPQGVVIAASPAFHPNGGLLNGTAGQPNDCHVVCCFDLGSLILRWAIKTRIGLTAGFNNLHGIWANKKTGHTYLFERWGGGGFNTGDLAMTTISQDGEVTGQLTFDLPVTGSIFEPCSNNIDSIIVRSDASVLVLGHHSVVDNYGYQDEASFTWSVILSPNGSRVERGYVTSPLTEGLAPLLGSGGCMRSDGKILLASTQGGTFVLDGDATTVQEAWAGGWGGRLKSAQMITAASGNIWWLETGSANAVMDLPTPGWDTLPPSGGGAGLPTMRIRELSPDGKYVLKSKVANVGPNGLCGFTTDSICLTRGRIGMVVGGWGLVSFSLSGKTVGMELATSYTANPETTSPQNTYAKFARWTGTPFFSAGGTFAIPALSPGPLVGLLGVAPTFYSGETIDYYEIMAEETADDVRWDRHAVSEL